MINTIDSVNRVASATGMAFTWDDNVNMAAWDDGSDDWAYRYDPEDRLINVRKNSVASARYVYDAGGRRVRSWDTAEVTDYVYSGLSVIDELRSGAHEKHLYAGSMHLASISSGATEYFHVDHLGSTRLKTDASGGVTYSSNYEPYGPEYGESGSEEFRYTGKQEDPTGLYYYGARYYDPVTGRFTTRDSVFGDLTDPQSLNRYVYCRNNPHKYTDPDGKIFLNIAIGAVAGGGLAWAFYFFELSLTGKQYDADEALARVVSGVISGAVAGATFGLTIPYHPAVGVVARAGVNLLGGVISMGVENEIGETSTNYNEDTKNDIINDKSTSYAIDTTQDIMTEAGRYGRFGETGQKIAETVSKTSLFMGPLITNTVRLFPTMYHRIDIWWEQNYIGDEYTNQSSYYGVSTYD